ncbi:DNA-3-methyladenine glycosylase I [Algoriphagus persicinus]|nr:DNA-3-methyladenine glycosylase I [Algoriphagus sp. E1-3-M2]
MKREYIQVYAHMQATGLFNDHLESCFRYYEV